MASTMAYLILGLFLIAVYATTKKGVYELPLAFLGRIGFIGLLVAVGFFLPFQSETWLLWMFLLGVEMIAYMTSGVVSIAATVVVFIGIFSLIMSLVRGI